MALLCQRHQKPGVACSLVRLEACYRPGSTQCPYSSSSLASQSPSTSDLHIYIHIYIYIYISLGTPRARLAIHLCTARPSSKPFSLEAPYAYAVTQCHACFQNPLEPKWLGQGFCCGFRACNGAMHAECSRVQARRCPEGVVLLWAAWAVQYPAGKKQIRFNLGVY